jgi:putative hydrolase of HD superfamily
MEQTITKILHFLSEIEPLKAVTRHSWTSSGRQESVPEHCWRMGIMAVLLEDQFPGIDIKKVLMMCLFHDLGEVDGEIPAFEKNEQDHTSEKESFHALVAMLPGGLRRRIADVQDEFDSCSSPEAQLAHALDKLEALIQHNDAPLSTWIELEYDLNMTYGDESVQYHQILKSLRETIKQQSLRKIKTEKPRRPAQGLMQDKG